MQQDRLTEGWIHIIRSSSRRDSVVEVAIIRRFRANTKKGPIGGGDGGEFVAFGGDSTENSEQLATTTENSLGI